MKLNIVSILTLSTAIFVAVACSAATGAVSKSGHKRNATAKAATHADAASPADSIRIGDNRKYTVTASGDTVLLSVAPEDRHGPLTEEDFQEVAEVLGVEPAAIKAVVEIEAGSSHQGFWNDSLPVINFDLTMFRKMARRNGVNLSKYRKSHAVVFARPNAARYGSHIAAQTARLNSAMSIHRLSAIQGTFWGMFQIGGFNWKKCGADSPEQFVQLMSRSERDQLDLFATFVRNSNLVTALKNKDWRAFASVYNGPGYARRGYHTRMAAAYAKHIAAEKAAQKDTAKAKDTDKTADNAEAKPSSGNAARPSRH